MKRKTNRHANGIDYRVPCDLQALALTEYAERHGRGWRAKLKAEWAAKSAPRLLQDLRDRMEQFGFDDAEFDKWKPSKLDKARAFFRRNVREEIVHHGAHPQTRGYDYALDTPIGRLQISVYDNWIACCFDDAHAGHAFDPVRCSAPCGKWNWHYSDNFYDGKEADRLLQPFLIVEFSRMLEKLLAYVPSAAQIELAEKSREFSRQFRAAIDRSQALLPK